MVCGQAVADVIRTCLGPRAMLKMLMDPMGGIVTTSDGNAILREITAQHPAAKSMIEISRTQDEEVGDGTTSVIILAGELLYSSLPFLQQNLHPTVIISAYRQALEDILEMLRANISTPVDVNNADQVKEIVQSCLGTKFLGSWAPLACQIALDAVRTVSTEETGGHKEIDIKRYAKVEKVPGGALEDSKVLSGIMINKDVTHPRMRRKIENPRIVLLDCPLEYKKGESNTNLELSQEQDFTRILELEEQAVQEMCANVLRVKPDLVITEKGVSDLAQHFLLKANVSVIRRVRKTDNNRIARATGATVVNRTDELREQDVGTRAGLYEVKKIGDEIQQEVNKKVWFRYFTFITECKDPKACTILLRGPSKDILAEVERNLQDALCVARNVLLEPRLVPGGGATEMAVGQLLLQKAKTLDSARQGAYRAVATALEAIPRTLVQNCGGSAIRTLTALRAKHAAGPCNWGVNGETGELADMTQLKVWEPLSVKLQTYKTSIETAILLLRIDDIVSGSKRPKDEQSSGPQPSAEPSEEAMKD
ncbi:CCT3 [Cordylochernes scorpioides]|uniref:T-complex protein 1 subunit gamma n=1 Tax=Cordylochernes scorpioides TaxID=51811 RepID=A0ABY6KV17_9ARAC|nr:CCT3 [Cordylochernes scorpioides]